jgi:hypothetical protein
MSGCAGPGKTLRKIDELWAVLARETLIKVDELWARCGRAKH